MRNPAPSKLEFEALIPRLLSPEPGVIWTDAVCPISRVIIPMLKEVEVKNIYSGGDGSSREQAVVIHLNTFDAGVEAE